MRPAKSYTLKAELRFLSHFSWSFFDAQCCVHCPSNRSGSLRQLLLKLRCAVVRLFKAEVNLTENTFGLNSLLRYTNITFKRINFLALDAKASAFVANVASTCTTVASGLRCETAQQIEEVYDDDPTICHRCLTPNRRSRATSVSGFSGENFLSKNFKAERNFYSCHLRILTSRSKNSMPKSNRP